MSLPPKRTQDDITRDQQSSQPSRLADFWVDSPTPSGKELDAALLALRQQSWQRICAKLRQSDGEEFYQRRLLPLTLGTNTTHQHIFLVGTLSLNKKQAQNLEAQLLPLWQSEHRSIERITIEAKTFDDQPRWDRQLNFDQFVTGQSNKLAQSAACKLAESATAPFTPLYIFGGVGLGKTHLMTAIALETAQRFPDQKILYMTAEAFMRQFVTSLRRKTNMDFKQHFHAADLLLIDDIHFLSNKKSTQDEFFHILNGLIDRRKKVVVASDRSPHHIDGLEPRVCSRLASGLVAEIGAPDTALRHKYLVHYARRKGLLLDPEVLDIMAVQLPISIRELEGAMNRLVAYADLMAEDLTLTNVRGVLRDILHQPKLRLRIEAIQQQVAKHYHIEHADLLSASRKRAFVRPRQVAMYLCKQLTSRSLPEIGRQFGHRDHTTVIHAIAKVKKLSSENSEVIEDIRLITERLGR